MPDDLGDEIRCKKIGRKRRGSSEWFLVLAISSPMLTASVFVHLAQNVLEMKSLPRTWPIDPLAFVLWPRLKLNRFQCKQRSIDYQLKKKRKEDP